MSQAREARSAWAAEGRTGGSRTIGSNCRPSLAEVPQGLENVGFQPLGPDPGRWGLRARLARAWASAGPEESDGKHARRAAGQSLERKPPVQQKRLRTSFSPPARRSRRFSC